MRNDLLDGIEDVKTNIELVAWLKDRPDRTTWLAKFAGITGRNTGKQDENVSAVVQTELPILEGSAVFATIAADNYADAQRLAIDTAEIVDAPTYVKHVRTRVVSWKQDKHGNVCKDVNGNPLAAEYAPVYKSASFYRANGSRPKVRDERWADSRGIIVCEMDQQLLERRLDSGLPVLGPLPQFGEDIKSAYGPDPSAPENQLTEYVPRYFTDGDHDKWWKRRESILGTRGVVARGDTAEFGCKLDRARTKRVSDSIQSVLDTFRPADEVPPLVAKPADLGPGRKKTRKERRAAFRARKAKEAAILAEKKASGQWAIEQAEIVRLLSKREKLQDLLEEEMESRRIAKKMHNERKAAGDGYWLGDDTQDLLFKYREFRHQWGRDIEWSKENIAAVDKELYVLGVGNAPPLD